MIAGNVVLIGAGKMGGALLQGWIGLGVDPARIVAIEPEPAASIEALAARGVRINPDPASICPDAIVIAVKPQIAAEIMPNVASLVSPSTVVISIMAGRTIGFLACALPHHAAVVRAMPNTPAAIGRGITVAVANSRVSSAQRQLADALLRATGAVEWIDDEALMDAELLHRSSVAAAVLRQNVTSPGGTTAAALDVLMPPDGLDLLMERAIAAATRRSRELAG